MRSDLKCSITSEVGLKWSLKRNWRTRTDTYETKYDDTMKNHGEATTSQSLKKINLN